MKLFRYSSIVNKNCHWPIKLCYYLGIIKVRELDNKYVIDIRFYNPIIIISIFLFYTYKIISDIFKSFKENIKNIINYFKDSTSFKDRHIIIAYKNENKKH